MPTKKKKKSSRSKHIMDVFAKAAREKKAEKMSEHEAAVKLATKWLNKAGFYAPSEDEDACPGSGEIIVDGADTDENGDTWVSIRMCVQNLDIEHAQDGTHMNLKDE